MGNSFVLFLSVLYAIFSVFLTRNVVAFIPSSNGKLFTICHSMYVLIYGYIPMLVHYHIYTSGQCDVHYFSLDYSENGCFLFLFSFIFSIIGYFGFLRGYDCYSYEIEINQETTYTRKTWFLCALICLIIGIFCFYMWTKVFGGPSGIIAYSSALRSGYDIGIDNPYTVFKRLVPLVQFSSIVFFGLFLQKKSFLLLLLLLVSFYYSVFYLVANDGRAPLVMFFVSIVFLFLSLKFNNTFQPSFKSVLKIGFVGCFAILLAHNADRISVDYFNSEKEAEDYNFDVLSSVREEFSYTVRSNQAIFEYWNENPTTFRMPIELVSGILGVLPSSFRPESVEKLERINTRNWDKKRADDPFFGGRPPDLIVTGIYTLNIFGIYFLPFILGIILKYIESRRDSVSDIFDNSVFYSLVLYPFMRVISYTNFDGLMLNFFYIFVGYILLRVVNKVLT